MQADNAAISQVVKGRPVNHTVAPEQPGSVWPAETELLFLLGMRKVMLTVQRPIMRMVIQDAFEEVQWESMFNHAFPDTFMALELTWNGLLKAAKSHDRAMDIHCRLVCDADYMNRMTRLVSVPLLITM